MLGVVGTLPRRQRQAIARVSVSALVAALPLLYVSLLRPPPAALAGDTAFWFLMSNCVIAAIVATADDDAGTLLFGSSNKEEPVACTNPMDDLVVAPPFLVTEAESADAANNKPAGTTDLPTSHMHVPALQRRGEQHESETVIEQSTHKNSTAAVTTMVNGHEGGEEIEASSVTPASDEAIPDVGKPAVVKADEALTTGPEAEPEPWAVPRLPTSKSLPDQEVQEEEEAADDEEWPYSRPPDVLPHDNGGRLRRSATDASESVAEDSQYWQLSDEELNRRVEDFIARFNRQMRLQIEQEEAGV